MQQPHLKQIDFPRGIDRFPNIRIHKDADEELRTIYKRVSAGGQAKLAGALNQRFRYLSDNLGREQFHSEWFEILSDVDPTMRSLRLMMAAPIGNLRLLYVIMESQAVILVSFIEHKKKDYRPSIALAIKRYENTFL